ncbi:MAG: hypothetical protein L3I91_01435 [Mycoplasma sp.]
MYKISTTLKQNSKLLSIMDLTKLLSAILLAILSNANIYEQLKTYSWILIVLLAVVFLFQLLENLSYLYMATRRCIYTKSFWGLEEEIYQLKRSKLKIKKTFVEDTYHKYALTKHYFFSCWVIFTTSIFVSFGGLTSLVLAITNNTSSNGIAVAPVVTTIITILNIIYNKVLAKRTTALYTYTLNKINEQRIKE